MPKKTTKKVKNLITQAEQLRLYLATSQILNSSGKVWSGIITSHYKILARFNNHQVVRPLEAKAYLMLNTLGLIIYLGVTERKVWENTDSLMFA